MHRAALLVLSLAAAPAALGFLGNAPRLSQAPGRSPGAARSGLWRTAGGWRLRAVGSGPVGLRAALSETDAPPRDQDGSVVGEEAAGGRQGGNAPGVLWKDAAPQRTVGNEKKRWMNQFPNTWEPAEKLALERSQRNGEAAPGSTVRVSGVELRAADPSKLYDVGLVGTGPAAIALAAELGRAGAKVCVVGPVQGAWPNNYGVWRDEWEELGLPERCIEETYASTRITISTDESISIPRGYGKVSGPKTREVLLQRCAEHGVEVLEGIVEEVTHGTGDPDSAGGLRLTGGVRLACRVPVVAAGHYSPLVRYCSPGVEFMRFEGEYMTRDWEPLLQTPASQRIRITEEHVESGPLSQLSWRHSVQHDSVRPTQHAWGWNWGWNPALRNIKVPDWIPGFGGSVSVGGGAPGYQIAYGVTVETAEPHGYPLDEMLLMDFSTDHLEGDAELEGGVDGHVPTFVYVFPYDERTMFVQETLLCARNHRALARSIDMEEVARRVDKRLEHLQLTVLKRYDEEYSVIPMGGPLPVLGQPTVAYGAAAVMVHPASGYMINRAIKFAPEVADALVDTLRRTDSPLLAAEAAWEAIWPKHRLIERDLYCFGMEVLLDLDVRLLRDFFAAFFADPKEDMWRKFLAWDMTRPGEKPYKMAIFMILQFFRGSLPLKARLVREAMFKDGLHLLKSIFEMPFPFD